MHTCFQPHRSKLSKKVSEKISSFCTKFACNSNERKNRQTVTKYFQGVTQSFIPLEIYRELSSFKSPPTKKYKKVTHCIFDLDGTILDSEKSYDIMMAKLCSRYGQKYTKELKLELRGATDHEMCVRVVKKLRLPVTPAHFDQQLRVLWRKYLPHASVLKGAERLLKHLHFYAIPLALATNSSREAVRMHEAMKPMLFSLFHHKVCASDPAVVRGKPNPDILIVTAGRFPTKPKPKDCLVFEDSVVGVQAANAAGMQVVMIPDEYVTPDGSKHATLVLNSLLEFKPELFGLPPFRDLRIRNK